MKWISKLFKKKETEHNTKHNEEFLRIHRICMGLLGEIEGEKESFDLLEIEDELEKMLGIADGEEDHKKIDDLIYLVMLKYKNKLTLGSSDKKRKKNNRWSSKG